MRRLLIPYGLLIIAVTGCKREQPTTWSPEILTPIAKGTFALDTWFNNQYLIADKDQLWHLRLERNLSNFNIDSLVEIPDTTIHRSLALPFVGGPISIAAGTEIYNQIQNNSITTQGAQLNEVILQSGFLHYTFTSYVNGELSCTCTLPGATLDGAAIALQANTAPTTNDAFPSQASGTIDLSNYTIDFTGSTGSGYNQLASLINIQVSDNASAPAQIFGGDSVTIDLRFESALVRYGKGYFGQHQYAINETIDFGANNDLPNGQLQLADATLNMHFKNYVGVDMQLHLDALTGVQNTQTVALENAALFDWLNFTRATDIQGGVIPSELSINMNGENSNIQDFIGVLPHQLQLQGIVKINPLGNISLNNDFIYTHQTLEAIATLDIPLVMAAQGLQFQDTLELTNEAIDLVAQGDLVLVLDNSFPCSVQLSATLQNEGIELILLENATMAGAVNETTPQRSLFQIPVTTALIQNLREGGSIFIQVVLNTTAYPTLQPITQNQKIIYQLIANGSVQVDYD